MGWGFCLSKNKIYFRGKFLECSPNFPNSSYLDEHAADVCINCFITFQTEGKFFSRDLFAGLMSVHNRNMKHVRAIEFDQTNLLAML